MVSYIMAIDAFSLAVFILIIRLRVMIGFGCKAFTGYKIGNESECTKFARLKMCFILWYSKTSRIDHTAAT